MTQIKRPLLGRRFRFTLASAFTCILGSNSIGAELCFSDGSMPPTIICAPAPADTTQFGHDTRMIDTGQQHQTGTYLDVEEIKRTKKSWPLGKPSLQNCRFCLEPNRQNAHRLKSLP